MLVESPRQCGPVSRARPGSHRLRDLAAAASGGGRVARRSTGPGHQGVADGEALPRLRRGRVSSTD